MSQSEVNMMMPTMSDNNAKDSFSEVGRGRKTNLIMRENQTQKMTRKQTVTSDYSKEIKKPRKLHSEGFTNVTFPRSKDKHSKPVTSQADDIWKNLIDDKKDENINTSLQQTENIWTNQGLDTLFGPETPSIQIMEQPEPNYRFRYGSEGEVVAPLHGANSNQGEKTFPKIKLLNFDKQKYARVDIFVSCVTHNEDPYPRIHPYLVKNNKRKKGANCTNGVCRVTLANDDDTVEFVDIGIQRVKAEQTKNSQEERKTMGIDPFNQGYEHSQYDKEAVKLCFQACLTDLHGDRVLLPPVTSNTISHTKGKVMSLHSVTPNEASSDDPVKLTILADNLPRPGDICVMFSTPCWCKTVLPDYEHHNCAVQVFTPKLDVEITHKTRVEVKVFRISNQAVTKSVDFFFLPPKETCQEFKLPFNNQDLLEGVLIQEKILVQNETEETRSTVVNLTSTVYEGSNKLNEEQDEARYAHHLEEYQGHEGFGLTHKVNNPLSNTHSKKDAADKNASQDFTFENLDDLWSDLHPNYMMPNMDEEQHSFTATTTLFFHPGPENSANMKE